MKNSEEDSELRVNFQGQVNQLLYTAAGAAAAHSMRVKQAEKQAAATQAKPTIAGNQHMTQVVKQQIVQKQKRRNFMEYLRNEPSSLGGKISDLPVDLQKQIADQYTKSQRRTMMDRIDRENK